MSWVNLKDIFVSKDEGDYIVERKIERNSSGTNVYHVTKWNSGLCEAWMEPYDRSDSPIDITTPYGGLYYNSGSGHGTSQYIPDSFTKVYSIECPALTGNGLIQITAYDINNLTDGFSIYFMSATSMPSATPLYSVHIVGEWK